MSNTELRADGGIQAIETGLRNASGELEGIESENTNLRQQFENERWSGLEGLETAGTALASARDKLDAVAEKVGLAQVVADARRENSMVGTRQSLGRD